MKNTDEERTNTKKLLNQIVYMDLGKLIPSPQNARIHSPDQIEKLETSIERFGFIVPVPVDEKGNILAGHGRVEAAKKLGMQQVPTIRIEHLTESEKKAFRLADNRLAEMASWDKKLVALELQDLIVLDYDIEVTGFSTVDADFDLETSEDGEVLPPPNYKPVTRLGNIWALGKHRLICGDATKSETYKALLGSEKAQVMFADSPYNLRINGHVKRKV
jgi:hypothetical protein